MTECGETRVVGPSVMVCREDHPRETAAHYFVRAGDARHHTVDDTLAAEDAYRAQERYEEWWAE